MSSKLITWKFLAVIPSYLYYENRMKKIGIGLNERFQPLIGPSDYNSMVAEMQIDLPFHVAVIPLTNYLSLWASHVSAGNNSVSEVAQLCPTLCGHVDYSLPGFSVHGIFQARILEWVAISFSRRSSQPWDWTRVSRIVGRRFTIWATGE